MVRIYCILIWIWAYYLQRRITVRMLLTNNVIWTLELYTYCVFISILSFSFDLNPYILNTFYV